MKISTKGRYGLASMIVIAKNYGIKESLTVLNISETLGISKIYLEQVFSLLRRANLVNSVKGAQGGYQLERHPNMITVYEILSATEGSLFEKTEVSVDKKAAGIEQTMRELVYDKIDSSLEKALKEITLYDLASNSKKIDYESASMFYI